MTYAPIPASRSKEVRGVSTAYLWAVVGLSLLGQAASSAPTQGMPVLYPFLQEEFSLTRAQVGMLTSAGMIGGTFTTFFAGWLTDRTGTRLVMTLSLLATGLLTSLYWFTQSIGAILLVSVLLGIVVTPGYPAGTRAIMDWIPSRARGMAMSIKQTGVALAGAATAVALPVMATALGWRMAAVITGSVVLLAAVAFGAGYRDPPRQAGTHPRMDLAMLKKLLRDRNFVVVGVWSGLFVALQFIALPYVVLFLVDEMGMSKVAAASYIAMAQVVSIVARLLWGVTSDFLLGARRVVVLGLIGFATGGGFLWAAVTSNGAPAWVIVGIVVVIGATALSFAGVLTVLIGELAGPGQSGTATGAVNTAMRLGTIALPPLFGWIVDMDGGSYSLAWAGFGVAAIVCTLALLIWVRDAKRPEPGQRAG